MNLNIMSLLCMNTYQNSKLVYKERSKIPGNFHDNFLKDIFWGILGNSRMEILGGLAFHSINMFNPVESVSELNPKLLQHCLSFTVPLINQSILNHCSIIQSWPFSLAGWLASENQGSSCLRPVAYPVP